MFIAAGVQVIMLSGDNWNSEMARQRNIPFYCTRGSDLGLDKSVYLSHLEATYNVKQTAFAKKGRLPTRPRPAACSSPSTPVCVFL